MNTQPNNPSDFNSLSELYMKACEARFQLLQERSELVMENFELRMQLQELRAQVSPSKADQKPKGLLMKLTRYQLLRRHDEITAETAAVLRRGKEIVAKLESGAIKPEDPQVKEVLQQLIERRRIGTEFNAELSRLADEQHNNTHTQC